MYLNGMNNCWMPYSECRHHKSPYCLISIYFGKRHLPLPSNSSSSLNSSRYVKKPSLRFCSKPFFNRNLSVIGSGLTFLLDTLRPQPNTIAEGSIPTTCMGFPLTLTQSNIINSVLSIISCNYLVVSSASCSQYMLPALPCTFFYLHRLS